MAATSTTWTTILCATDLSEASDEALNTAIALARRDGARLVVFHALPLPIVPAPSAAAEVAPAALSLGVESLEASAREQLQRRLASSALPVGSESLVEVASQATYAAIVEQAEARGADLIVVAAQGETAVDRALLGRTAEKVARYGHTAVLVTRPTAPGGVVLVATDLSDPSRPAIRAGLAEAARRRTRCVVLHCLGIPVGALEGSTAESSQRLELRQAGEERLAAALTEVGPEVGVDAEPRIEEGEAASEVVRVAHELGAELVVVGHKGKTGLRRVLLGSTAESVVSHAPCSVLVVRQHPDT